MGKRRKREARQDAATATASIDETEPTTEPEDMEADPANESFAATTSAASDMSEVEEGSGPAEEEMVVQDPAQLIVSQVRQC